VLTITPPLDPVGMIIDIEKNKVTTKYGESPVDIYYNKSLNYIILDMKSDYKFAIDGSYFNC